LGKKVKAVFEDAGNSKVVRGTLKSYDEFIITLTDAEGELVVIGKRNLISLKEED